MVALVVWWWWELRVQNTVDQELGRLFPICVGLQCSRALGTLRESAMLGLARGPAVSLFHFLFLFFTVADSLFWDVPGEVLAAAASALCPLVIALSACVLYVNHHTQMNGIHC